MTPTAADQKAWSELLDGLPDDLRYTPLNGDKCPIDPDTGFRRKKWETFHYLPSGLDQMNGVVKAVGLHLGPTSNGVLAVDFDGIGSEVIFQNFTGHQITELPKTIRWSSGQMGHEPLSPQQIADNRRRWGSRAGDLIYGSQRAPQA